MRIKFVPERFQFPAQFRVIVDLAVERNCVVAAIGVHRLVAAGKIDDLQPHRAK